MKKFSAIGHVLLAMTAMLSPAMMHAQNVSESCLQKTYDMMARDEREYRSVLFGQKASEDLPEGSVRFDEDGNTWMKTGKNSWKSLDEGFEGTTWSDRLMDERADLDERRGIFETRAASTSDLIPPLLQSMRALQCKLQAICDLSLKSQKLKEDETDPLTIKPDGCIEFEMEPMMECRTNTTVDLSPSNCLDAVDAILEREEKLLQTVVAYDAAYRSLSQFAGIFEGFLNDFRFPLIEPIWQMVRALGSLDNMPCFNGQCDE